MLDIWATCRYDLQLSDREIGKLNLKEYDALLKRLHFRDNLSRLNAGIIASAVYNAAPGDGKRKALSPLEFVPDWKDKIESQERDMTKMTPEEQRDHLFSIFGKKAIRRKR
jgi:hypothetical protein